MMPTAFLFSIELPFTKPYYLNMFIVIKPPSKIASSIFFLYLKAIHGDTDIFLNHKGTFQTAFSMEPVSTF